MATIKSEADIKILREAGKRLAAILLELKKKAKAGVSSRELDLLAEKLIRDEGDEPAFLNYTPRDSKRPYPATLCVSVNDEVVHGIPNEKEKILKDGDIVGLDLGLKHQGLFVDAAITVPIGEIDEGSKKLIEVTKRALEIGIAAARPGKEVREIGCAIEKFVKPYGYGIVEELGGHGVGYKVHEEPHIPNFCTERPSTHLKVGMVIAIEPIINEGTKHVVLDKKDGYTYLTADHKRSAHFEHTVFVSEKGPEILTEL